MRTCLLGDGHAAEHARDFFQPLQQRPRYFIPLQQSPDGRRQFIFTQFRHRKVEGGMPVLRISDLIAALIRIYAPRFNRRPEEIEIKQIGLLPGEKLYEELMTSEEALHAKELEEYFMVEPLNPVPVKRLDAPPAGYDSVDEPILSVDEIIGMIENHGLVEIFLEAMPELPQQ